MIEGSRGSARAETVRCLSVALWGACIGVYLAALILLPFLSSASSRGEMTQGELGWLTGFQPAPPWQSGLQKKMYILHCLCGPLLAWFCVRRFPRRSGWLCVLAFGLFVPLISKVYKGVFQADPNPLDFLAAGLVLGLPLLDGVLARMGRLWQPGMHRSIGEAPSATPTLLDDVQAPSVRGLFAGAFLVLALAILFFWPRNIASFADAFTGESHLASYFFGPALCFRDPDKVPGLDFESLYGVGHAYVYSFFMGETFHEALCGYLWFMFAVLCFYFLSAYVVLAGWYRSARTGTLVTLALFVLAMESLSYRWPSCWPVRFPFLFVFLGCASRERILGRPWVATLLAGACAGLAFFWQSDNGLVLTVAGVGYCAILSVRERTGWWRTPLFLLGTGGTVVGLMLAAFGPRTLSLEFYQRLMEPLVEAGSGFGWHLMRWHFGWTYLYNLIGPLTALATLGWCVYRFGRADAEPKREARFLFLASAVGLLMLFKWVNRAMDLAWTMNAAAIVVVLFWWLRCVVLAAATHLEERSLRSPRWLGGLRWHNLIGAACLLILLGAGWLVGRLQPPSGMTAYSDSPLGRVACFTRETPTPANWLLSRFKATNTLPASGPLVDEVDVAFVRQHSGAAEPVAVLAPLDWIYLADANRRAAFHWVPVYYTHTHANVERVVQDLKQARAVFVQRDSLDFLKNLQPSLHARLVPILESEFMLVDAGKALDRYVRRDAHVAVHRQRVP